MKASFECDPGLPTLYHSESKEEEEELFISSTLSRIDKAHNSIIFEDDRTTYIFVACLCHEFTSDKAQIMSQPENTCTYQFSEPSMWCYVSAPDQEPILYEDFNGSQWTSPHSVGSPHVEGFDTGAVTSPSDGSDRSEVSFLSSAIGLELTMAETKSTKQKSSESFSTTKRTAATKLGE